MSSLVIVESPTKARTIRNYLPDDYRVEASMGHVRDLPQSASEIPEEVKQEKWASLGVNVENGFTPIYVVPKDKEKIVRELKSALRGVDELLLATDEDREGESISWHLLQLLQPKVPVKRMVFHEITREAIQQALQNCRTIDERLVHAQETRRILDRLVGYTLSPLLWKKIAGGLSAGRVQSVSVRLLVQRERQRRAFRKGSYWDLKATLMVQDPQVTEEKTSSQGQARGKASTSKASTSKASTSKATSNTSTSKASKKSETFEAKLVSLGDRKVATGSDFDESTGQIAAGRSVVLLDEGQAQSLRERLLDNKTWTIANLEERPQVRKPSPPFTTSTLQQEANRKLGLSARRTMQIAQSLYERGFITYMRTDSVHLSDQAITAARACVQEKYGPEYLSPKPRQYSTKSKNAQEAHEAIRPAGSVFRTPQETGLRDQDFKLYDLIWKRTVASQMAEARQTMISVQIQVEEATFRASGKRIDFPGFFRAYVEGSDDPEAALEGQEVLLPPLAVGDTPACQTLEAIGHETQPPARYTEASLVKALESEGIGRPSTYASIIGTIVDRDYAHLVGNALVPTFTAFAVTDLLENHFPDLVDTGFTARMEQTLDDISTGEAEWLPYLHQFYGGEAGLANQVKERENEIQAAEARTVNLDDLPVKVRIGRYGAYLEVEGDGETEPLRASIPRDLTPAELTEEQVELLLKQKTEGPDVLGHHPETGEPIYRMIGPYGPYVQLGDEPPEKSKGKKPKRASLPKGTTLEEISLETAVGLLSLPRNLGEHPETGAKIQASLGRFGPYVVQTLGKDKEYRSLKAEDDVLTVGLDRALELLAQPKRGRGAGRNKPPLRELGSHPDDQEPVNIYEGPYGVYIKHGKINIPLPEGQTPETMTLAIALPLLAVKASTKGKRGSTKSTGTKSGTKSSSTKSSSTKSSTKSSSTKSSSAKSSAKSTEAENASDPGATDTTKPATTRTTQKTTAKKTAAKKATTQKTTTSKTTRQQTS